MLKPIVKRGLLLDFIPDEIIYPADFNQNRVYKLNDIDINGGDVIYIMSRELRLEDNWGLIFASELAKKHQKKFKVIINIKYSLYSNVQLDFIKKNITILKSNLAQNNIDYKCSSKFPVKAGALVCDFNPISPNEDIANNLHYAVFEVDSHNIIPARYISKKQEFSAATLRKKIYGNIANFLTEYPQLFECQKCTAYEVLEDFIQNKLDNYSDHKNDPNKDFTSNLSPYLHFGLISAQRVALEVFKSNASKQNKEAYLEELIVRKELSDNYCLYNKKYKSIDGIPDWAQKTLNEHRADIRAYTYSLSEFEFAKTHDELWNAIQLDLISTGKIHGYLRMYWAKKILEWSKSPEDAIQTAIYLNDEYALDGHDPNGYVGILWSIGGLHDRAFTNRLVTGKIRYMNFSGCKKKFDVNKYIGRKRG